VSGPQPISATLAAGESVTFSLTYTASQAGSITWQGIATGPDAASGITATTYTYDHANRLDYFYADGVPTDLTHRHARRSAVEG